MTDDPLVRRARSLWVELAGAPVGFRPGTIEVVVSPRSRLCPPGWAGIVDIDGAVIATAPDDRSAEQLRRILSRSDPLAAMPFPLLGPATLAYCDAGLFRPVPVGERVAPCDVEALSSTDPAVDALRAGVSVADDAEAGLDEITSQAFVVRGKAAAGYQLWPPSTAHLCVLTAGAWRGRGLARRVAAAATADALASGLLPQWRARPEASRRVAAALGFRELGTQLSVRLTEDHL